MANLRNKCKEHSVQIFTGLIVFSIPLIYILPYSIARSLNAKRKYYMHQLLKRQFIAQSLGLNLKKMKLKDLKKIVKDDVSNY